MLLQPLSLTIKCHPCVSLPSSLLQLLFLRRSLVTACTEPNACRRAPPSLFPTRFPAFARILSSSGWVVVLTFLLLFLDTRFYGAGTSCQVLSLSSHCNNDTYITSQPYTHCSLLSVCRRIFRMAVDTRLSLTYAFTNLFFIASGAVTIAISILWKADAINNPSIPSIITVIDFFSGRTDRATYYIPHDSHDVRPCCWDHYPHRRIVLATTYSPSRRQC